MATQINEKSIQEVFKELNSGFGDSQSFTNPYKIITGAALSYPRFDENRKEMCGHVEVQADQQSPYGDGASTSKSFYLSLLEINHLARTAPRCREDFTQIGQKLWKAHRECASAKKNGGILSLERIRQLIA